MTQEGRKLRDEAGKLFMMAVEGTLKPPPGLYKADQELFIYMARTTMHDICMWLEEGPDEEYEDYDEIFTEMRKHTDTLLELQKDLPNS